MKKKKEIIYITILIAVCSIVISGCGFASSAFLESEYALEVTIDSVDRYVSFTETISIRNIGESDISCLYFHLYGNKFCGNSRSDDVHIDILSISDDRGRAIEYDLDNSCILVRVNLPEKLAKGNQIKLTIEGFSNLPSMNRIYGLSLDDEIHLPMFYAQLSVFDEKGWHTDLPQKEGDGRYAECSDYDVTIIANKSYDMLCNGRLISKEIIEDSIKTRYICEQRRDLVICGSDKYTIKDAEVGNVRVLGYFNERYDPKIIDAVMNAATETVAFLSNALSEYPYDTLIITDSGAGVNSPVSMEYSGLVTIAINDELNTVQAVYHEIAHQWFYSIVGNDENKEAWLDESLANYMTGLCMNRFRPKEESDLFWEIIRQQNEAAGNEKINMTCDSMRAYLWTVYGRGTWMFKRLADEMGEQQLLSCLSKYCNKMAYKNASGRDLLQALLLEDNHGNIKTILENYIVFQQYAIRRIQ